MDIQITDPTTFVNMLFFYYIKRQPYNEELKKHTDRFKTTHNNNIDSMKHEFAICSECINNKNKEFVDFIDVNTDASKLCIKLLCYFDMNIFLNDNKLSEYIEYYNSNERKLTKLLHKLNPLCKLRQQEKEKEKEITKLLNSKAIYIYQNDDLYYYGISSPDVINIDLPVYHLKYDAHAGHVFACVVQFIHFQGDNDYVLAVSNKYYEKFKHIMEFYDIVRPNRSLYLYDKETYSMNLVQLPFPYNSPSTDNHLFVTQEFYGARAASYTNIISDNNYKIVSVKTEKEQIYRSPHLDYTNKCVKLCLEKHDGEPFYDKLFLVKNNKCTIFNRTPYRGFSFDEILNYIGSLGFHSIDPQHYEFSKLVYLVNEAKVIITSWNTIMYINKFFFNPTIKIIVLCHSGYHGEYAVEKFKRTIYYADNEKFYFIFGLETNSITEDLFKEMLKLLA